MKKTTKSEVLRILRGANGEPVSGETLAEEIGVSRNSVWKAVTALKEEGYEIDGKQKRGYVLSESDVLSAQEIGAYLNNPKLADKIILYAEVDSTNSTAKRYAAQNTCSDVFDRVFIAETQTAGRGRLGRSFYSPPKSGLYISFLLHPGLVTQNAVMLTTAASVVVCDAVKAVTGADAQIKWVNDVFLNDRKICGILTEAVSDFESGAVESVVIGIGINISTGDFPNSVAEVAGNLGAAVTAVNIRSRIAAELINRVESLICGDIIERGDFGYLNRYRACSMVLGKEIRIVNTGETARAVDIDNRGGLVIETEAGRRTLSTGEISIRLK